MLTKRQKQILDFYNKFSKKHGYSPSLEETAKHFHLSSASGIHQHIQALIDKGYLSKQKNQPRGIEIEKSEKLVSIPLLGTIAAGQPIEAIMNPESIAVPKSKLPKSGNFYALRVAGDSMVDENINDGDTILVKQQSTAENGQKVVALLNNNEATLKKFYKERGQIRLQPANKNFAPIIVKNNRDISIQGVLIDVIKNNGAENISIKDNAKLADKEVVQKQNLQKYLNKIYQGDIMDLLKKLPDKSVNMVFGDPDYNVGIKYNGVGYTRNFDEYIDWYIRLTEEAMRVLKDTGNLFMMNYPKQNAHLRVKYLDNNFPEISEYVWIYNTNVGHTPRRFTTAHRSILHVRKNVDNKFFKDAVALPYKNPTDRRIRQNLANGSKGRMPYSWFEFNLVKNVSREKTYHACQIPQKLTEMLVKASTKQGDVVLVLFGGSGAEIDVCKNLNRQFISAEIDPKYHEIITDRLNKGYIQDKYKLKLRNGAKRGHALELPVFNKGGLFSLPAQK